MKQAKRLFSILLAVALIVGSVAVAANAADPILTYEGSVHTYSFETDIGNEENEVAIGGTFTLSIYSETNFVPGTVGGEFVSWDIGVLNTISRDNITFSEFAQRYDLSRGNFPAKPASFPAGYTETTHTGAQFMRLYSPTNSGSVAVPEGRYKLYDIAFSVPEDETLVGRTVTFEMPVGAVRTQAFQTNKAMTYQAVNSSATNFGSLTGAKGFAETVNVPAPLTITIVSNAPTIEYCDYTDLQAAKDACDTIDPSDAAYYDEAEYQTWVDALAAANALLDAAPLEKTPDNEATIANAAAALRAAFDALDARTVDLTDLNAAIADCGTPEKAADYYDADDYSAWQTALADAQDAVTDFAGKPATAANDAEVADLAADLRAAFAALDPQYVDLAALEAAIADCGTPEKAAEYYDEDDYAAWQTALEAAQAGVTTYTGAADTDTNRTAVAGLTSALTAAFAALTPDVLDVSALSTAITNCTTPAYTQAYYDTLVYGAWATALNTANTRLSALTGAANTQANREEVASLASDLTAKFAALVPNFIDLAALNEAIEACDTPAYTEEFYDATAYAEWQAKLDGAQAAKIQYTDAPYGWQAQNTVNAWAEALTDAFEALVPQFVDLAALNEAIEAYDTPAYEEEYYDAALYAAWEEAFAAAQAGVATYTNAADTEANRTAVAGLASTLTDAFEALVPQYVDLTALNTAIEDYDTPAYAEEYYDADDYAAWEAALAAAQTGVATYTGAADTADNQAAVAGLASTLTDAFAALVPAFVDYTALEAALEDYGTAPYPAVNYTENSYAAYSDALSAAQAANERGDLLAPASDTAAQQAINDAAAALEAAYERLELVASHITSVTTDTVYYQKNETVAFDFVVDTVGASKIQVIRSNGTTATYERTHSSVAAIVDNGDGTETWTINIGIITDDGVYQAKAKFGKVWDTGVYPFNIKTSKPAEDTAVISTAVIVSDATVQSFTDKDTATVRVVTGKDTLRVRYVTASGLTITMSTPVAVNEDGTKVWEITKKFNPGEYTYTVWTADSSNKLQATNTVINFTVEKFVIVPSQGVAVYSASVAKTRFIRGGTQTFTVVTDKNASAVRLIDAKTGLVVKTVRTGAAAGTTADTLVWSFDKKYTVDTAYNYKVEALYGVVWMASDATVSFNVIY